MLFVIVYFCFVLCLLGCESNRLEVVEVFDNNAPKEAFEVSSEGQKEAWYAWYRNGIKAEEMNYENGVPNGTYKKWNTTGVIIERGAYKDSLRDGKWTFFEKEKRPYMQGHYKKGLKDGRWTFFDENGKITGEQYYRNDSAVGLWKKFEKNIITEENSCHNANKTGYFKSFYEEGKTSIYQECKFGKPYGVFLYYYPGGTLAKVGHFENALKTGLWVEYFANGKLRKTEHWIAGIRNGEWARFDETGFTLARTEFIDGGGVFEDTSWHNNRIHGEIRTALKNNEYLRVETYENGAKISSADYLSLGNILLAHGLWANGKKNGAWRTWYRSGVLKDSLNFKDGEPAGEQFHYDSTGRLYKKETSRGKGHNIVEMY